MSIFKQTLLAAPDRELFHYLGSFAVWLCWENIFSAYSFNVLSCWSFSTETLFVSHFLQICSVMSQTRYILIVILYSITLCWKSTLCQAFSIDVCVVLYVNLLCSFYCEQGHFLWTACVFPGFVVRWKHSVSVLRRFWVYSVIRKCSYRIHLALKGTQ